MGISSAMNAGVMGLSVNSSKLATISDNIANSETKGYKRASIEFNSLVLTERPTTYDAGGVRASTVREIDDQGALLSTRNSTDLAISGRGFLPVTDVADVEREATELPLKLLRTGAFRPDQNGVMQTNSGLVLMGWRPSADGTIADQQSDLEPVRLDSLSLAAEATTAVNVKLNLNADATADDKWFETPIEYYDTLGKRREVYLEAERTKVDNQWNLYLFEEGYKDNLTGEYLKKPALAYQVTFETEANANPGGIKHVAEYADDFTLDEWRAGLDFKDTEHRLFLQDSQFVLAADGSNLPAVDPAAPSSPGPEDDAYWLQYETTWKIDSTGNVLKADDSNVTYWADDGTGTYVERNLTAYDQTVEEPQIVKAQDLTFDSVTRRVFFNREGHLTKGPTTDAAAMWDHDSNGSTAAEPITVDQITGFTASGQLLIDGASTPITDMDGNIPTAYDTDVPPTDFVKTETFKNPAFDDPIYDLDSELGDSTSRTWHWDVDANDERLGKIMFNFNDGAPIELTLGSKGSDDNLVQFAAASQTLSITKDGSPTSTLTGIEIDETGLMDAIYDTGFRKTLYKIPVANVQNPNGMRTQDGQAFSLTRESGSVYFYDAGEGPTGSLVSSALEESTTDVAEELTQLIKTQRAYSSNAKIIQTVDEMLQETTNLKR